MLPPSGFARFLAPLFGAEFRIWIRRFNFLLYFSRFCCGLTRGGAGGGGGGFFVREAFCSV